MLTVEQLEAAMTDDDQLMVRTRYGQWRLVVALYGDPERPDHGWVGTTSAKSTWRMTDTAELVEMMRR